MKQKKKVIHYMNQFFGQLGGEQEADAHPQVMAGPVGPGKALYEMLAERAEIVATIVAGDNFSAEHPEELTVTVRQVLDDYGADLLVAGPAFSAGRYGLACAAACRAADEASIPAVTGMHPENPAVAMYRGEGYVIPTGTGAAHMKAALDKMAALTGRILSGAVLGDPGIEDYLPGESVKISWWIGQVWSAGLTCFCSKSKGIRLSLNTRCPYSAGWIRVRQSRI